MTFERLGRAFGSLPAEILIPIMIVSLIIVGIFYAKGKIPRTLTMNSMIISAWFLCAGLIVYTLGLPLIISSILMILGVVSILVSFFSRCAQHLSQ